MIKQSFIKGRETCREGSEKEVHKPSNLVNKWNPHSRTLGACRLGQVEPFYFKS